MSPAAQNNNIFITENTKTLRSALVNLSDYMDEIGLADFDAEVPEHPRAALIPPRRYISTADEWALQTAIDIDELHLRLILAQDKEKAKKARRKHAGRGNAAAN